MKKSTKVFISFHKDNKEFVHSLKSLLNSQDITLMIIDLYTSLGDLNIYSKSKLEHALAGVDYSIVVLSKAYLGSEWLMTEAHALKALEMNGKEGFVVPIIIDDSSVPVAFKKDVQTGFLDSFENGSSQLLAAITRQYTAFIVMKLGDEVLDSMYRGAIKPVAESFDYSVVRIDEIENSGNITSQILNQIVKSEVIIADLTDDRPNCYYEVGYAQALGKEIILCKKSGATPHFDLAGK